MISEDGKNVVRGYGYGYSREDLTGVFLNSIKYVYLSLEGLGGWGGGGGG